MLFMMKVAVLFFLHLLSSSAEYAQNVPFLQNTFSPRLYMAQRSRANFFKQDLEEANGRVTRNENPTPMQDVEEGNRENFEQLGGRTLPEYFGNTAVFEEFGNKVTSDDNAPEMVSDTPLQDQIDGISITNMENKGEDEGAVKNIEVDFFAPVATTFIKTGLSVFAQLVSKFYPTLGKFIDAIAKAMFSCFKSATDTSQTRSYAGPDSHSENFNYEAAKVLPKFIADLEKMLADKFNDGQNVTHIQKRLLLDSESEKPVQSRTFLQKNKGFMEKLGLVKGPVDFFFFLIEGLLRFLLDWARPRFRPLSIILELGLQVFNVVRKVSGGLRNLCSEALSRFVKK